MQGEHRMGASEAAGKQSCLSRQAAHSRGRHPAALTQHTGVPAPYMCMSLFAPSWMSSEQLRECWAHTWHQAVLPLAKGSGMSTD